MNHMYIIFLFLLIIIICITNHMYENFENQIWNTQYPNYLSRLYKPIYTYVFYEAYNRDIHIHRKYRIGFYSLDGTISNISSSLIINNNIKDIIKNNLKTRETIQKNQFHNIDNRIPFLSEKSIDQFKIFSGNDISIDKKWEWFFINHKERIKDFSNWIYYCNSFADYMTRNMYTFTPVLYKNFDDMFDDFKNGYLDFFISPNTLNIQKYDNFSFLYHNFVQLGHLYPKLFDTNIIQSNHKIVNIYKNNSLYNEYFTQYFTKYLNGQYTNNNITYTYYNELNCFSKFPEKIHTYGVLKCSNTITTNSIPFNIYTHSPQSKYCIQKKNYKQIKNMFNNQKQNYLNLINLNLNNFY